MKIVIIGSGNVAYHLSKAFHKNKIVITQIFGRNEQDLKAISNELNISFSTTDLADADLYLICVNDDSVKEVSKKITKENCLVAHSSGSLPKEILEGNYRKASFYPLQTFSKSKKLNYAEIPFFVEAENDDDENTLKDLASEISDNVMISDYEKRKYIHLTAVFCCNFVNHLFARAKEIADSQNIPFSYFFPLIDETVEKIHSVEPKLAQTGPAVRNDKRILEFHRNLMNDKEHLKIYKTMNESIKKMYEL
jgi:predicted short-subunit dehydrogenase-like oxidoreductase (DUF2520 family)